MLASGSGKCPDKEAGEAEMRTGRYEYAALIVGRLIVGGMYLSAGITNLIELDARVGYAASKGLVAPTFFVPAASVLLAAGAISILTGLRPQLGLAAVAVFLIGVTPIMHNFWGLQGLPRELEFHSFMGNLGLLGGALLALTIPRPWPFSVDRLLSDPSRRARTAAAPTSA
jgi:uncharacterized membrane protein YphA (DoxX/SURF4 family)